MQNITNVNTIEEKLSFIEKWKASGQSRKIFAQEHNLNYTAFRQWVYHYAKKDQQSSSKLTEFSTPSSNENFVSIQIENVHPNAKVVAAVMEITLSNGSHVCFFQNPSAEYLRELLK
jgi:hypothetical protein